MLVYTVEHGIFSEIYFKGKITTLQPSFPDQDHYH